MNGETKLSYNEMSTFKVLKTSPAIIVNWQQFTKHSESGNPLHAENGFLKILPMKIEDGVHKAELMLSHPFSLNEYYTDCSFDFNKNELVCEATQEQCF